MKLTARDRRAAVLGACVLAALFVFRFVVLPWWDAWGEARGQAASCRGKIARLEKDLRRLGNLQDTATKTYGPSATKPPAGTEAARIAFTKTVQDVLKAGGITFETITAQPVKSVRNLPNVELLPFQVKGKCKLSQLARCLAGMRNAPLPVIVDRIRVSNNPKKPGELELTMVLATLAARERSRL